MPAQVRCGPVHFHISRDPRTLSSLAFLLFCALPQDTNEDAHALICAMGHTGGTMSFIMKWSLIANILIVHYELCRL
eukprot:7238367-Prymnesium_polylepis.1